VQNNQAISMRIPLLTRRMVKQAAEKTGKRIGEYYVSAANAAAHGILEHEKSLKLLPEWVTDERERKTVSVQIDRDELIAGRRAAKRLMATHTHFVIWSVLLVALGDLGHLEAKMVVRQVNRELNGTH